MDSSSKISSQLFEHYENLMNSDAFCDFVLKCAGEEFRVHKCILAARSPMFAAMFTNDMEETQSNMVDIVDVAPEILRKVLRFIYCGQIEDDFTDTEAAGLLYAAEKYQLDLLKEVCVEKLKSKLCVTNVFDVLVLGDLHDQSLKDYAMDFICKYPSFAELKEMDKWKSLQKTHSTLINEVMTAVVEFLQESKSENNPGQTSTNAALVNQPHKEMSWAEVQQYVLNYQEGKQRQKDMMLPVIRSMCVNPCSAEEITEYLMEDMDYSLWPLLLNDREKLKNLVRSFS